MSEPYSISLLPSPITIAGKVIHGDQSGRTIGFPTANLDAVIHESDLKIGIYFGTCTIGDSDTVYSCLPYFGPRLVFGEQKNQFEIYIYDFDQSIYGQTVTVTCTHFLRDPLPFTSLEALRSQLNQDKKQGKQLITAIMNS